MTKSEREYIRSLCGELYSKLHRLDPDDVEELIDHLEGSELRLFGAAMVMVMGGKVSDDLEKTFNAYRHN